MYLTTSDYRERSIISNEFRIKYFDYRFSKDETSLGKS